MATEAEREGAPEYNLLLAVFGQALNDFAHRDRECRAEAFEWATTKGAPILMMIFRGISWSSAHEVTMALAIQAMKGGRHFGGLGAT